MYSFIIQIIRKGKKRRKKEKGKEKVRQLNRGYYRKGLYDDSDK